MNTNPSSQPNTRFWRSIASFLCCLRRKSPQNHFPPNPQNFKDIEAQHSPLTSENKNGHISLESSPENAGKIPPTQAQPLSDPQPPLENNSQTIFLPQPFKNLNSQSNIQEITQNGANLRINPLNSQEQSTSKICTVPSINSYSLSNTTTAFLNQISAKKDPELNYEISKSTNHPKSSLEDPHHLWPVSTESGPTLPIHLEDISVHSENTLYHTARDSQSQENMDDQLKTEDPNPKPEPQNDGHQIQEKENFYPSVEADILQRRPKPQDLVDISKVSNKSGLSKRGFNNPSANYCFAHALLQILYGLPEFKEKTKRLAGQEKSNEVLNKLCELFENIEDESRAQAEIERTKEELIERIKQKNQGITIFQPNGGDSRVLFQVLADNICEGRPFKQNPLFSLFSTGNLIKQVSCKNCPKGKPKKFLENSLMINAREDLYFSTGSPMNFFQANSELRSCSICNERTPHSKEISLESLPKILALRIEDCSSDIPPSIKPRKKLEFYDNRGRKKDYKFFGGVYNTKKGFDGIHSVAYIQETENGTIKFYNDFMVRNVTWEDIHGYAKLLFYFEENP